MPDYKQEGKPIRVNTPLDPDVLLLERMTGHEDVSKPFEFTLEMLSLNAAIDPADLLRKPITVEMDLPDGSVRYINGIVRRFVQLGRGVTFTTYIAEVVPTIWLLSLSSDCRIFQSKKASDIVKQVFDDYSIKDYKVSLTATDYPVREYCVQYRETHLDFISRLLEEEGIFYFFEHANGKHTIVLADAPSAVKAATVAELPVSIADPDKPVPDTITEIEVGTGVPSGKVTLFDYNDTLPKRLEGTTAGTSKYSTASISVFDYPGKFDVVADADRASRLVMEERESLTSEIRGKTNCTGVCSGYRLDVTEHYRRDVNASYQILSVQHQGWVSEYVTAPAGTPPFVYTAAFTGIPQAVPYRPSRLTPRSIVHGSQTALVVGPSGEEIYVDKYGRVKVQFFWDRTGKSDENSSCWMRVSSTWAGKNWGFIQIPRIGQEVIVDFLEGDPDRPIITGRVYNAELMPPYTLPANGTQSGLKTRSSKGGGAAEANELRFEDKKGSEEVYLHSQKDLNVVTEDAESWKILKNGRTTSIKKDDVTELQEGNQTLTITKGTQTITVEGDRSITIKTGNDALVVKTGNMSTEVDTGNQTNTVKTGNYTNEIKTGNHTTKVSLGNHETDVSVGNLTIKVSAGKISMEAMQGIDLKVGGNSVSITPSGITVKGIMVSIQGQATAEVKSPMTTVSGDGMLTLKGGIAMIN